ncbi:hypothetical protein [Streptomyces sp. XY006]|nr:hypothetical protein [Streptomyces sp. XY006]
MSAAATHAQHLEHQSGDWLADYLDWKADNGMWDDGTGPVRPDEEPST